MFDPYAFLGPLLRRFDAETNAHQLLDLLKAEAERAKHTAA